MIQKIKSVQQDGTYNSKHDNSLLYKHEYVFEDEVILQASHKTQNPFKVGDEVEYTIKRTHETYGNSGTVQWVKDDQFKQNAFQGKDKVQTYIIRQSSLKIALDFMNVDPNSSQETFTTTRLKALAEDLTNYVLNGIS